jgi:nitroreductase
MAAAYAVAEGGRYRKLKQYLPAWLVGFLLKARSLSRLAANYWYDGIRFARSSPLGILPCNQTQYDALVTMNYHRVEKGLSLPQPKPYFGEVPIRELLGLIERHASAFGRSGSTTVAVNALRAYLDWHQHRQLQSPFLQEVADRLDAVRARGVGAGAVTAGGTDFLMSHPQALASVIRDEVFRNRRSVRDFAERDVALDLITEAVSLAMRTPSVCNRQAWKVRCLTNREQIDGALRFQNGNRGFGHTINRLLIVTATLGSFVASGERNQGWVDGGMFSMALLLALHTLGLATIPLNWSTEAKVDRSFRRAFGIPEEEIVLMFIGVGHYKDGYAVCQSPRVDVDSVLSIT